MNRLRLTMICIFAFWLGWPYPSEAYSVLTHEAIVDTAWETHIRPLLLERFPKATLDDLRKAHAYAYGGAIIQDMGYYPHGNKFFSDLTHYIRSGDFINEEHPTISADFTSVNGFPMARVNLAPGAQVTIAREAIDGPKPLLSAKWE